LNLSRRTFLIAGASAATIVWLTRPEVESAAAEPTAAAVVRPHRTLLGVL
jgi:hypothetical protein